jgi:hypothetical protein
MENLGKLLIQIVEAVASIVVVMLKIAFVFAFWKLILAYFVLKMVFGGKNTSPQKNLSA